MDGGRSGFRSGATFLDQGMEIEFEAGTILA